MTVSQLAETLSLRILHLADGDRTVTGGYAGDLLSWVMGRAESGDCWVTIMSNMNVAAVAQLTDVACVVFSEGVRPDPATLEAAADHDINLLASDKPTFALCGEIARLLE